MSRWEMGCRGGVADSCYRGRELRVTRGRAKDSGGKEQGVMNKVPQHKGTAQENRFPVLYMFWIHLGFRVSRQLF